ncbi:putative thymidylate kinase [uncultured archaeon]|nr:putative thymidylate kinase [uncultured archaeon]
MRGVTNVPGESNLLIGGGCNGKPGAGAPGEHPSNFNFYSVCSLVLAICTRRDLNPVQELTPTIFINAFFQKGKKVMEGSEATVTPQVLELIPVWHYFKFNAGRILLKLSLISHLFMPGFFIVFEGLDGSGKGTCIKLVHEALLKKGFPKEKFLLTAEPTAGYYGRKVRELLKQDIGPKVNAAQFLDLYVSDRKEHIEKVILPGLAGNKIILCDRYKYSTFVYQQLQGIPIEKIRSLHELMPVPDLVFILDIPAEVALKRISRRKSLESFERRDFMEKVRAVFLELKGTFPQENLVVIDASKEIPAVKNEVAGIIENRLKA